MRQEIISAAGVDMELALVRDSNSRHWLVMARWHNGQGKLAIHTMPPLATTLTADEAWGEARAWAMRTLTRELLKTGGLHPDFYATSLKRVSGC